MDISADRAIQISTEKFIRRFNWMEKAIKKDEKDWNQLTIKQIGVYWDRSKTEG
jgi:XTP/dITP diphosphohydrolase